MKTNSHPQYISQLNAFYRFTSCQYLPQSAQLLWYKLIGLCNACGWPEWVQIDTMRLMVMLDVKSRNAAFHARDALVEAGLLVYEPGQKGCPNRYRLIYFPCTVSPENDTQCETENDTESGTEYGTENEPKAERIIRQDKDTDKTRQNKTSVPAALSEVWRAYADMRKKMRKPLTESASALVLQTLGQLAPDRPDEQKAILEQSILNGWAGVYPIRKEETPEVPPASYDVEAFERELLYGKIEYHKRGDT